MGCACVGIVLQCGCVCVGLGWGLEAGLPFPKHHRVKEAAAEFVEVLYRCGELCLDSVGVCREVCR